MSLRGHVLRCQTQCTPGRRHHHGRHRTSPTDRPDHFGWNLKQIIDIKMTEDERDLILRLNAARVFGIDPRASA